MSNGAEETPQEPVILPLSSPLVPASSLLPDDTDPDDGDFGPDGYRGLELVPQADWPSEPRHDHLPARFYVRSGDLVGMVPWPGSKPVWPGEAGWAQDMYRPDVESLLKEEKKK